MSMRSSFSFGYGFDTNGVSVVNALQFLKKRMLGVMPLVKKDKRISDAEIEAYDNLCLVLGILSEQSIEKMVFSEDEDEWDNLDEALRNAIDKTEAADVCFYSKRDVLLHVVCEVIASDTRLPMIFEPAQECDDCIGTPAIILPLASPWNMTEAEKKLASVDALADILKPYMEDLGIPDEEVEFKEIEYYG